MSAEVQPKASECSPASAKGNRSIQDVKPQHKSVNLSIVAKIQHKTGKEVIFRTFAGAGPPQKLQFGRWLKKACLIEKKPSHNAKFHINH
jgi:hypothetical protein